MTFNGQQRHQLIQARIAICITWSASCVVEIMLLSERLALALALTTTVALGLWTLATKRWTTRERRENIKVSDLRAARSRRR